MSQPKKHDIADFFRANARPLSQIPRKRPTPDRSADDDDDDDSTVIIRRKSVNQTPTTFRLFNAEGFSENNYTPIKRSVPSLTTPISERSIAIPIRSPGLSITQTHPSSERKALFTTGERSTEATPKARTPFAFADAPNVSRKVVEDGKLVAVRDSDDSDNESLVSLSELLKRKVDEEPESSAEQSTSLSAQEDERLRLLSIYTGGRSNPIINKDRIRALQLWEKQNKLDMSSVLDEAREAEESRARIVLIEAELEETTRQLNETTQKDLDKKMLASILQGGTEGTDPDEFNRLMNAVDRTEALSGEKMFSFFGLSGPRNLSQSNRKKRAYPPSAIPFQLWQAKDITARNNAYLSGFMTELAHHSQLSDQALRWTYDSIPYEADNDLRHAYIGCVAAASPVWTRANIAPQDIQDIFIELGAEQIAVRDGTVIEPRRQFSTANPSSDHDTLLTTLAVFDNICQDMDLPCLSKLISLVCRLCLDHKVMNHNRTVRAVESLLRNLVDHPDTSSRQHIHERILFDLGTNMKESVLQAQFMTHLIPKSATGLKLRTGLATTFLMGSRRATKVLKVHSSGTPIRVLFDFITDSRIFNITPDTDFQNLAGQVFLLEIAISTDYRIDLANRAEVDAFNAQVDNLADKIHDLFTSIADAGASHLKKTEAKDALQALHNRLLLAVRTKVRRKKHVFETNTLSLDAWRLQEPEDPASDTEARGFMSEFLKPETVKEEQSVNVP